MADATGSQNLLGSLITSAFQFATPFAQNLLGQSSTPTQLQQQTLKDAALNGSGPIDPTLAKQAPLGLTDFLTGGRLTGQTANNSGGGGLSSQNNLTFIGIIVIALVAVVVILKR